MTIRAHRRRVLALGLVLAAAACADPVDAPRQDGEAVQNPIGAEAPERGREELAREVGALRELLAATSEQLSAAAGAETPDELRAATDAALELLIGEPDDGTRPLFPVETGRRGSSGGEDRLTSLLTMTREAGGVEGREVRELVRDLVAGDLGAWQRDADGMVAMARDTTTVPAQDTEQAVFELPGEATRALAWALLADDARDLERAREYAARGATHLDVAVTALDELGLDRR